MIKKFNDYIKESDGSTTASPGSGTAVGSGDVGSFTSAAGQSVSGGDSGSAFSTNSNTTGMGNIVSPQPSSIPGDVAGSTKGSGDISTTLGAYTKKSAGKKKKKDKKSTKRSKTASNIDKFYVTTYSEKYENNNVIQKWDTYKESVVLEEYKISELFDKLYGVKLEKKGNFGQELIDIYIKDDKYYYKLGQLRNLKDLVIFYPDSKSIESKRLMKYNEEMFKDTVKLSDNEKYKVIEQLKKDKKLGDLDEEVETYFDIIKNIFEEK